MNIRTLYRLAFFGLMVLILASILTAVAAANTVPSSYLADQTRAIAVNDLKPPECSSLTLDTIVSCGNGINCNAGNGNDLVLGSPSNTTIRGQNGNDCIVDSSSAGSRTLVGGNGTDVCIGYASTIFDGSCEQQVRK